MKAHKYWSLGALVCMAGCFYTGCMGMAIYSGHKIAPKKKTEKPE